MPRKRFLWLTLVLITILNIMVFLFRDHFQFQPASGYNALYAPCNDKCIKKWKQYADDYSSELKEAKQITDPVVSGYSHTVDKVLAIENFLYTRFSDRMGRPTDEVLESSPLNQFKKLSSSDTAQLWCGNFAQMLSLFCWSQGIITRYIGIVHPGNNHALNECYIPETQSWMVADVTTNQLAIKNRDGKLLNLIAFRDSIKKGASLSVIRSANGDNKPATAHLNPGDLTMWYTLDDPVYYFHYTDNYKAYAPIRKVMRYVLPVSWFDIYSSQKSNNLAFYVKVTLVFLWLVSFFMVVLYRPKFKL